MSMKNSNETIGNRTCDLLAYSAVPQTTAPRRAPAFVHRDYIIMVHGPHLARVKRQKNPANNRKQTVLGQTLQLGTWAFVLLWNTMNRDNWKYTYEYSFGIYSLACIRSNKKYSRLFNDVVNRYVYVVLATDKKITMEHCRHDTDRGKASYSEKSSSNIPSFTTNPIRSRVASNHVLLSEKCR